MKQPIPIPKKCDLTVFTESAMHHRRVSVQVRHRATGESATAKSWEEGTTDTWELEKVAMERLGVA